MSPPLPSPTRELLADDQFRRFLAARTASGAGNVVTLIALPILAYRLTGSPSVTALVAACEAAPYLLFGLFAGALSDRWNRQRVMVTADSLGALLVASLPVAHVLVGEVPIALVVMVAFLGPTIGVFFDGASFGALPTLVGRERVAEANSLVWGLQSANELVLPAVVGVVLAVVHPSWLLAFDAVTFAVAAATLATLTRPMYDAVRVRPPFTPRQLLREVGEGVGYLVRHPGIRTMTVVGFVQCVAGGGFVALMVVWIDRRLDLGTEGLRFGLVWGSWAVGSIVAALLVPRLLRRAGAGRIALLALPVSLAAGLVPPFVTDWRLAAVALLVWSVAYTTVTLNTISYRLQVTPEPLLGRVNTAGRMLSWGCGWTGGTLLAGVLVGPLGLVPTLLVFALVPAVAVATAWTSPLRRTALTAPA